MTSYTYISYVRDATDSNPLQLDGYEEDIAQMSIEWEQENGVSLTPIEDMRANIRDSLEFSYRGVVLVANEKGTIVGFGTLDSTNDPQTMEFGLAYVRPEYRRQGIFKDLTQRIVEHARSKGATFLVAHPSTEGKHIPFLRRKRFFRQKEEYVGDMTYRRRL